MNKALLVGLRTVHNEVAAMPKAKGGSGGAGSRPDAQAGLPRNALQHHPQHAAVQNPKQGGNYQFLWMIGIYVLFNYVLK